ncbi:hypothetical protein [Kutzneria sp. CA-103260]|uniref:hypothetical protein n=1 Tax=Kutzneria sp. CA-103260 TaxID=2802641 RepID=UPI001BA60ADB|nr:hypothetical protein [Kutzneria sp. CA-103260]
MFADQPEVVVATVDPVPVQPSGLGGSVDQLALLLNEVHDGRYGLLDATGRAVEVDGDQRCRHTEAEATLDCLLRQRYLKESDQVECRHGVIARPVTLRLTPAGERLRRRWSHLRVVR